METNVVETPSFSEQRGAGGKWRKPPSRRPPPTPYARPQQRSRWLSKLVDPAVRLISGSANLIFPSLFSRSSELALPAPHNEHREDDCDNYSEEQGNSCCDDDQCTINHGECGTSGASGPNSPSCTADRLKNVSNLDGCKQDKGVDPTDNDGLSEIERLIKGKTFSRDDINHLMEIVHSRVIDLPEVEQTNKHLSMTMRRDAKNPAALENPGQSIAEKQDDWNKALRGTSSAVLQSSMLDEVGASPVDIARAFMGTRPSEAGIGYKSVSSKDESGALNSDEFALKPFIPSPSPKPSVCWPGAMLQDRRGYLTPQSERGRFGLQNFPRTPYSRTIFSKSKSKITHIQGDGNRSLNMPFAPLQQSKTPIYEQSRRKTLDDEHGSVGPIRRIRHKAVAESPSKQLFNFRSSLNNPSPAGGSNILEGFLPAVKKNLEPAGTSSSSIFQSVENKPTSSEVGVPTVHPHSSQIARTILDHLERNPPTPKDKSAELKLATLWKKPQSSTVPSAMPKAQSSSLHLGGLDSCRNTDRGDKKDSALWKEAGVNTIFKPPPQENAKETKDSLNGTASASNVKDGSMVMVSSDNVGPSEDLRNTLSSQIQSRHESDAKTVSNAADGEVPNVRKPSSHSFGSKPVLPGISIGKPGHNWAFSSDSSSGFTFPVSTSSSVFSEPPTPSIVPSFSGSGLQQLNEGSAVPRYSFGLEKSTHTLVFSFPSTSGTPPLDGDSDLKFNFGSDETRRISFSSIGKDAMCY